MAVYIIRAGEHGPVKIGFSNNLPLRQANMQADNHEKLRIVRVFVGEEAEERLLHLRFAHLRIHGEWFSFSREMLGDLGLTNAPIEHASPVASPVASIVAPTGKKAIINRRPGLKQKQIAADLGVSEGTISKWLNRESVVPTGYLQPLARLLEIEVTDLLPAESDA